MSKFHYQAVDSSGQAVAGTIEAVSVDVARQLLEQRGLVIEQLDVLETPEPLVVTEFLPNGRATLSVLTNLRALGEDILPRHARPAVQELADRIERGESPLIAFAAVRERLPEPLQILLELGLERGRLDLLLSSYLDHNRRLSDIRSSLWTSLAYPVCLFVIVMGVCLGLMLTIVPMFARIFDDFGTELPAITRAILEFSYFMSAYGIWLLLGGIFAASIIWLILLAIGGRPLPQRLFRNIPCVGSVFRWASLATVSEFLAMLVELELPLPDAFQTTARFVDDYSIAAGLKQGATQLADGVPIHDCELAVPRELSATVRWANQPAVFVDALRSSSQVFSARSRVDLHLTRWMLEPIAIFLLAFGVGLTAISLFMPLVKLLNDLS
ncbi:hypothetical protein GC163_15050 [bacterium]|nr:hypothetical protein [bacterium]